MKDLYPDAQENIPPDTPELRDETAQTNLFVDADHVGLKLPEGRRRYSLFL